MATNFKYKTLTLDFYHTNKMAFESIRISKHDFAALDCIVLRLSKTFLPRLGNYCGNLHCTYHGPDHTQWPSLSLYIQAPQVQQSCDHCSPIRSWWMFKAGKRLGPGKADCFWFLHSCVIHLLDCWHKYFIISWPNSSSDRWNRFQDQCCSDSAQIQMSNYQKSWIFTKSPDHHVYCLDKG